MRTRLVGAATVAVLAAGALATTSVLGSSHREAPRIMLDPAADNTDVYAFVAPDAPDKLTVVANWVPLVSPAGGPYFGKLDPEAHYYVKIDNTGDGVEDVAYRWRVQEPVPQPGLVPVRDPAGQLDQRPATSTSSRPTTCTTSSTGPASRSPSARIARNVPVAPDNVGPKTCPNYAALSDGAIKGLAGGGKTFVGPVDDPFFIDLGAVFDGINIDKPGRPMIGLGNQGGGKDDVSGYNTHAFALQVPQSDVTRDGTAVSGTRADNAVVGVWATTERLSIPVNRSDGKPKWKQVSRLGNPLINEVDHPDRQEGQVQRHGPRDRREELRRRRAEPGAGEDPQPAVQPRHQGERPHGHRPGAADRRPRADADLAAGRPRRHAEGQPRRAADGHPEPLRRARR